MLHIRGESGLGDSIYLYPIVKSYLDNVKEPIAVYSNYPEVFEDLKCLVLPFSKNIDDEAKIFSYLPNKSNSETTILEDITSSCPYQINFYKEHKIKNHNFIKNILKNKPNNKKICIVRYIEPRHNKKRLDNVDCNPNLINRFISEFKKDYYFVGIGTNNYYKIKCDMDLMGQTSVSDLFDLVFISNLVIAQVGYTVPLCELLHKNNIAIFPKKWQTANLFLKTITPNKICGQYTSHTYDDQDFKDISRPKITVETTEKINHIDIANFLNNSKKIAIVGNATSINNYNRGEFIDSHDCVIRMNRCLVNKKVGYKTNIWVTGFWPNIVYPQFNNLKPNYIIWNNWSDEGIRRFLNLCLKKQQYNKLKDRLIINVNYQKNQQEFNNNYNQKLILTTGMHTILYILDILLNINNHKINIFGFDFFKSPTTGTSSINFYQHQPKLEKKYIYDILLPSYQNINIIQ